MRKIEKMLLCMATLSYIVGIVNAAPVEEWNKTFGMIAKSVQQTKDGGYILSGYYSHECGIDLYDQDARLVKTDNHGNILWSKTFGDTDGYVGCISIDQVNSVQQTKDGGYILAGYTASYGNGGDRAWLIKTDNSGKELWNNTFGIGSFQYVQQTTDGGYILAGKSYDNTWISWILKTDNHGKELWNSTFGDGSFHSAQQTKDGGYILAGESPGYITSNALILKTDSHGHKLWNKTFGHTNNPYLSAIFYSVQQTKDGNYILSGQFYDDAWLLRIDDRGNELWNKTFGSEDIYCEIATSIQQTIDGGYILTGYTGHGGAQAWLIKTDINGNKQWNIYYDSIATPVNYITTISAQQTKDEGYILAGNTILDDIANYHYDAFLVKLGPDTMIPINLLKNSGFETVSSSLPQYWTKSQTGIKAVFTYPAIGRVGGKSVAIRYATKETGKVALWQQTGITVVPSKQYKLSGYMKLEGVTGGGTSPRYNGASLRINWYTSTGTLIRTDLITKSGTVGWNKHENIFTAPSNAAKATVGGNLYNAAGKVTFDDVSFVKI